jgi:arylsulfatase A
MVPIRCTLPLLLATLTGAAVAEDRPNLLLILADDVGREVLGCYGGRSYATPRLDELASGGIRFQHCYSMPVCHPTRICLLTGRYPKTLGNPAWGSFPRDEEEHTFAAMLKRAGYKTAVAGKWQLSLMRNDLMQPARMGFQQWSLFGWHEGPRYHDPMVYENGSLRSDTEGKYGPDLYTDFLIDFMEQNRNSPFLAYYSMALCHDVTDDIGKPVPYGPRGRWFNYKEMAEEMDRQIGKLIDALERLKLRGKTLVLFTGDNGTAAASYLEFEDGKFVRPKVFSKLGDRLVQGGKGNLNDWGTRVPLIANWPGHVADGQVAEDLIDFSDFLPTLCDLAGVDVPAERPVNGVSFAGRLLGDTESTRKWAYSQHKGKSFARTRNVKLYSDGRLFDMLADPDEKSPLEHRQDEISTMLRDALESIR